jgi:PAS domain S-box-containing protein
MQRETGSAPDDGDRGSIAVALLAQQVSAHRDNTRYAIAGSSFSALFLVGLEWSAAPHGLLLGWLAALAMVLGLRLHTGLVKRHEPPEPRADAAWLKRHRAGLLAHGVVWAAAGALPLPQGDVVHLAVLIVMLAGVTVSSFTMTAFDLRSALLFGAPVLGLLSVRLLAHHEPTFRTLGIAAVGSLVFMCLTARRAQQVVSNYVTLRVAAATQADALRASEELLERTGATAGVGGWEFDPATTEVRLTSQTYRIHEMDPLAQPDFEAFVRLYGASEQADLRAAFDAALARGVPFDLELPLVTVSGRRRWVRLIGRAEFEGALAVRVSGVVQDITQAKTTGLELAEKHHLLSLLVRTTSEGYWFIDADTVTTDVNPAMCEILRCTRADLIGKCVLDFVDAANEAVFREQFLRRANGVAGGYEITLTRPDGTQVDCFNNATPIFDTAGRRVGSIGMWIDISERKRVERQLRAMTEQLRQKTQALQVTLDSITQGIVSMDAEGHALVYNRRALELLDLPESLVGPEATYDDILRFQIRRGDLAEDGGFVDEHGRRCHFEGGRANAPEVYVRATPAGTLLEVRTRQLPDGGLVRTFADVTAYLDAQRALRDSEARIRALLDAFPGGIAMMDSRLTYTYVNQRFAALVDQPREAIIGRSVREILGEARSERVRELVALAWAGEPVTDASHYEASARRAAAWVDVTYAAGNADGSGQRDCYAFGIDVTARKLAEQGLITARDEAERANRAKSQFLSSMSHELRTPMNAILGFGQLLVSDTRDPLTDRQRGHVREILRGGSHLLSLINEVLDLAQVEAGKLQVVIEPVGVLALLRECLGLLHPLTRAEAIEVRVLDEAACDCHVLADRTRLKQVLLNLLANAIKYNRTAGHVRIECTTGADGVRIGIGDDGPGLSAEQAARLFQAFERLDAGKTGVEGAGLGLALARHLMQAMGGDIGLDSEPGRGSLFWVRLPGVEVGAHAGTARSSGLVPLEPMALVPRLRKVLYIEDNPVNVLVMEAMLTHLPQLQLLTAPLPVLGLQMAIDERPDLILLDIQLPGMDGFEVLRRLRLDVNCRRVPVIAVSANAMAGDIEHGLAVGFSRYLTKPVDMPQLLAAVEDALAA